MTSALRIFTREQDDSAPAKPWQAITLSLPGEKYWFYSAVVGSGPAEFLIDSGAEITLLDIAFLKSIRDGPPLKPRDVQLSAANGRQIEVFGEVLLPITLGSVTVEHHMVVCNLSGKIGIIGEDLLS